MPTLVAVSISKILQTRAYTLIVLAAKEKKFGIYMEPHIGDIAQSFFSNETPERPQTFDFIDRNLLGLEIQVQRVLIYDLQEATYYAKILYEQPQGNLTHLVEVEARPSDALLVALRHHTPIFVTEEVLEKTVEYVDVEDQ